MAPESSEPIDDLSRFTPNRFNRNGNPSGETLGDYAFDKFQEWTQSVWLSDEWVGTGHPLDPAVVEAETQCLLDIPYLWLQYGSALEVVATFEDWLIALVDCIADILGNSDYKWIFKNADSRELRVVAEAPEAFHHPALQRGNFERIKLEAQLRREKEVIEALRRLAR